MSENHVLELKTLEALRVLYDNSTDASERAVVSNYLSSFQRSLLSWNVTLNLLSRARHDSLPVVSQLFAAQTLKEKLRTQSYQLSQDSWQPIRSCIISVLQRPCDAALETQACLCLVTVIIILNIADEGCVSQLQQLISPARLLRVLQLLAEELTHDSSPYEPAPGVDKVSWWLQAQRSAISMAPAVFNVVSQCISPVAQAGAEDAATAQVSNDDTLEQSNQEPSDDPGGREGLLTRALECSAAWFKLGVLFMIPAASYEGVVQEALSSAAAESIEVSTAACAALAEAFERCPDPLLLHLQPQILDLARFSLQGDVSEDHQYQLVSLIATYVQSSADSLVAGGSSDLLQQLFAAAAVRAQNEVGDMAAAHAVDALVAVGRALQTAVKEEGASGALPAQLQGMLQACKEGAVGLVPVLQATLEACVEDGAPPVHSMLLEQLQECSALIIPQIGATAFCEAASPLCSAPDTTAQEHSAPVAAVLTALSAAPGALSGAESGASEVAQGILHLMEQCRVQAEQQMDTAAPHATAAKRALFDAIPVFAPVLLAQASRPFFVCAPLFAAAALEVLRQVPCSGDVHMHMAATQVHKRPPREPDSAAAPFNAHGAPSTRRQHNQQERESAADMEASDGPLPSTRTATMSRHDSGERSQGLRLLCEPASSALTSLIKALRGSDQEAQIVQATVSVLNAVPLPSHCDTQLLVAAFLASVNVQEQVEGRTGATPSQDPGLPGVAWKIADAVENDTLRHVQTAANALGPHYRSRASTDTARMSIDTPSTAAAAVAAAERVLTAEHAVLIDASQGLVRSLRRAAALLGASLETTRADEDSDDSAAESVEPPAAPRPAAVSLQLLSMLTGAMEGVKVVLSAPGVSAAVAGPLRRTWGKALAHAVALDAKAAEAMLESIFDVVAEAASVDLLVDWQDVLAVMMSTYLPRAAGFSSTAHRILTALQTIWTLSELQALPCPGEADMIPEVSVASSTLCTHVARAALTPTSWLSMESVVPLVEVGMARCSMAASASLRHVASAALSALLSMLSAASALPESSLSPVAGCVLRGGGTMMMGFACALTAPGAVHRVLKLTQLLLQLTALVARAVPLLSANPLVSLPHPTGGGFPLSVSGFSPPPTPCTTSSLSPAAVTQGVSYVLLWLKHALACLRPGMLQAHTPSSICATWQPLLSQALLAGITAPVPPAPASLSASVPPQSQRWQALLGPSYAPVDAASTATVGTGTAASTPCTTPSAASQHAGFPGSASPFVGLPAAAVPLSLAPGSGAWGNLGAGMRFGSTLRADTPFAAQLSPNMTTGAAFAELQAALPASEAFDLSEALASSGCRALKKAVRAVVASVGTGRAPSATPQLSDLLSAPHTPAAALGMPAVGVSSNSALPQHVFQQALCVPGNPMSPIAQPLIPFVPHVLAPAHLHVPVSPISPVVQPIAPVAVAPAVATPAAHVAPGLPPHIFAASAAPTPSAGAFLSPAVSPDVQASLPGAAAAVLPGGVSQGQPPVVVQAPMTPVATSMPVGVSVSTGGMGPLAQQLEAVVIGGSGAVGGLGTVAAPQPVASMDTDDAGR